MSPDRLDEASKHSPPPGQVPFRSPGVARAWLTRFGLAAFLWALAFGLVSAYWALGGMLGVDQLSPALRDDAGRRETAFVAILWMTAVVKVIGGLVPLALAFDLWLTIPRRVVSILTWLGGILLALYGIGDILSGTVRAIGEDSDGAIWYAVLWGPIWLVGGILYLGTAWFHRRESMMSLA